LFFPASSEEGVFNIPSPSQAFQGVSSAILRS